MNVNESKQVTAQSGKSDHVILHSVSHSESRQVVSETFHIKQLNRKTQNCFHGNAQPYSNVVSNIRKEHFGIVIMVTHNHSHSHLPNMGNSQELFPR